MLSGLSNQVECLSKVMNLYIVNWEINLQKISRDLLCLRWVRSFD